MTSRAPLDNRIVKQNNTTFPNLFNVHDVYANRITGTGQLIGTNLDEIIFTLSTPISSGDFSILGSSPFTMTYVGDACVMFMTTTACISRISSDSTLLLGIYVNDVLQNASVGHVKQAGDIDVITTSCIANVPQGATIKVKAVASANVDVVPVTVGTETSDGCILNVIKISQ